MLGSRAGRMTYSVGLAAVLAVLVCVCSTAGQDSTATVPQKTQQSSRSSQADTPEPDCIRCHTCERPTPDNRCLLICTRHSAAIFRAAPADYQVPDVILLSELEDAYLPVPFDHKGHADMAEMGEGCVICHHHTPAGQQHPACRICHGVDEADADIDKPTLLGAYHQQCLNCHREWINERDCDICHRAKAGRPMTEGPAGAPTKDDILTQMHPPIPEPDTDIYGSRLPEATETQVVFRHQEHAHRFGLKCVECHHEPSCARCHAPDTGARQPRTRDEHHAPCIRCHRRDMDLEARESDRCQRCHWKVGRPKPEPFDHTSTGWPLSRYHRGRVCRECHVGVPFMKLDRDCNRCHSDWSPTTFDHRVTGQILDENHAEHDCDVCHVERNFDRPPTCDDCHEEEEGISFPAKRPGPRSSDDAEPSVG